MNSKRKPTCEIQVLIKITFGTLLASMQINILNIEKLPWSLEKLRVLLSILISQTGKEEGQL